MSQIFDTPVEIHKSYKIFFGKTRKGFEVKHK